MSAPDVNTPAVAEAVRELEAAQEAILRAREILDEVDNAAGIYCGDEFNASSHARQAFQSIDRAFVNLGHTPEWQR